jgi:hypothetical protein
MCAISAPAVHSCLERDSLILFFFLLAVVVISFFFLFRNRQRFYKIKKTVLVPPVFICGFVLYFIAYNDIPGTQEQLFTIVFRSILSSVRMFFSFSDIADINTGMYNDASFMLALSITNLAALVISFIVILQLLGNKTLSWLKYRFKRPEECFIFFDVNDTSIALAKNILNHRKKVVKEVKRHAKPFIVFLRNKSEMAGDQVEASAVALSTLDKISADKLFDMNVISIDRDYSVQSSLDDIGVRRLLRIAKCHLFFLADDENLNIQMAVNIKERMCNRKKRILFKKTVLHILYTSEQNEKLFLRYPSKANVKDEYCHIGFNFFNQSELSAMHLIKEYPPVKYIGIDTDKAVATEDLSVLILGFGEIGQYSLRYLIEQGQFIGSTFHAVVVDRHMDHLLSQFMMRYPGLTNYDIRYMNLSRDSREYFELVASQLAKTNYVVVAYGDDNVNIDAALELHEIMQKQTLPKPVPIFVNVKRDEDEPLFVTGIYSTLDNIYLFGMNHAIFSVNNIIDETIVRRAKMVNDYYNMKSKRNTNWERLPSIQKISNISSAMHLPTKLALIGLDEQTICDRKHFPDREHFETFLGAERKLNLAKTEHLRWMANYYVHGWQVWETDAIPSGTKEDKDFKLERHACLVDWERLPEVSKLFQKDYQYFDDMAIYDLSRKS